MDSENIKISKRELILSLVIGICLTIAIFTIIWSRTPNYRPLVQDINIVDAVKIVDILEIENLSYETDLQNHTIYVKEEDADTARLSLARIGIILDYPKRAEFSSLPEACELLNSDKGLSRDRPVFEQYWFTQVFKTLAGMIVIIILILGVVRPALRKLIYPDED